MRSLTQKMERAVGELFTVPESLGEVIIELKGLVVPSTRVTPGRVQNSATVIDGSVVSAAGHLQFPRLVELPEPEKTLEHTNVRCVHA